MALESAARVMNGTFGQIWEDGTEIAEVISVKITGSMTLHKVFTRGADAVTAALAGRDLRKTLVGKLADPDAYGAERVAAYGVSYDEQTLMDWAAAKSGSITIPFQATDVEYLDKVEA